MPGLLSTFNVAKRGMEVQQTAINVTSHNISNANTEGYSRQRAIIETTTPFGMPSMNSLTGPGQIGTGAQVSAIQRVRDAFTDYQVRQNTSIQGEFQARDSYLSQIESIFNEPSDTGLSTTMGKFFDAWQQLSKQPQSSDTRTVVAQQSAALADMLNNTATQLTNLKTNAQSQISNDVFQVNNILNQIDDLNQQIMGVKIGGQEPNDLMDKRDSLIDQLSSKFNINIDKQNFEGQDIKPVDIGTLTPNAAYLVKSINNSQVSRFSYIKSISQDPSNPGQYVITYCKNGDTSSASKEATMNVSLTPAQYKTLDENRVIWADSTGAAIKADGTAINNGSTVNYSDIMQFSPNAGEVQGYMSVQSDIDDYSNQLDKVAKALAFAVNAVHSANTSSNPTGSSTLDTTPFFVNSSAATYTNGNLTSGTNGESNITAANISINKELLKNVMEINAKTDPSSGETDGARALAIAQLRNSLIDVQDMGENVLSRDDLFDPTKGGNVLSNNGLTFQNNIKGTTLDNYFKDTVDRLGVQEQQAKKMVQNQNNLLDNLTQTKESTSGVSLDEEMANLVQYQRAYQANAKIISTVDELLDVVVNGLKK